MVKATMDRIMLLKPENLTVHTLAIKRSSKLKNQLDDYKLAHEEEAKEMLGITELYAKDMGLRPYYMYRQKYMVGNLENIGYSLPGHECIYNIQIMEERQSIIGFGAGAVTKLYYPNQNRLERIPNVTDVKHYINRIDEMIERKEREIVNLHI
jgi:coproporphyrinogen III oxidase-like Fe-S oxidoreductase